MTLIEMLMTAGIGGVVLIMVALLYLFGLRSFGALVNYTDMDAQSRLSVDQMTREIRQATQVSGFQKTGIERWLRLTNALDGNSVKYTWNSDLGTITCEKTGQPVRTMLKGCDDWAFSFYQRTPNSNGTWSFYVTTNQTICKLIDMTWKCSRTNIIRKFNTESMVTAQIVLRNKP